MSALVNPTWWLLCAALGLCLVGRDPRRSLRTGLRTALATPLLVALACAAAANLGARAMLGHAVPGDFVQEVIAARALQAGATLYPAEVNVEVRAWLAEDPPALPTWLPAPAKRGLTARQAQGRNSLVAQAHPPTLLVAAAPAVLALGPYAAYWALTWLSLAAAALAAGVLVRVFAPAAPARAGVLAALALVSWQPFLATVRDGQPSAIVGSLLILAWADLRRGRDVRGGVAIGAAAALKLYPALLLIPLAVRHRRACGAALLVLACAAAGATLVAGAGAWTEYAASARVIAASFAHAPYNLSIAARLGGLVAAPLLPAAFAIVAIVALAVTLAIGTRRARTGSRTDAFDREFASFATLALLLSPVAWHHYVFMLALPLTVLAVDAWRLGGRPALAGACLLALVLSLPDDVWRAVWRELPARPALLVSPGIAVVLVWTGLLHRPAERAPGALTAVSPGFGTSG